MNLWNRPFLREMIYKIPSFADPRCPNPSPCWLWSNWWRPWDNTRRIRTSSLRSLKTSLIYSSGLRGKRCDIFTYDFLFQKIRNDRRTAPADLPRLPSFFFAISEQRKLVSLVLFLFCSIYFSQFDSFINNRSKTVDFSSFWEKISENWNVTKMKVMQCI